MKVNYGKQFEKVFAKDWERCLGKESPLIRIKDNTSGYFGTSRNPCDFIGFANRCFFMLEVKCHYGNTFPFASFPQYERLLPYIGKPYVYPAVVIWYIDHDEVIWVPMETAKKMKEDGLKSINIRKLDGYDVIRIPSKKKRVFLESDYSFIKGEEYGKD